MADNPYMQAPGGPIGPGPKRIGPPPKNRFNWLQSPGPRGSNPRLQQQYFQRLQPVPPDRPALRGGPRWRNPADPNPFQFIQGQPGPISPIPPPNPQPYSPRLPPELLPHPMPPPPDIPPQFAPPQRTLLGSPFYSGDIAQILARLRGSFSPFWY